VADVCPSSGQIGSLLDLHQGIGVGGEIERVGPIAEVQVEAGSRERRRVALRVLGHVDRAAADGRVPEGLVVEGMAPGWLLPEASGLRWGPRGASLRIGRCGVSTGPVASAGPVRPTTPRSAST